MNHWLRHSVPQPAISIQNVETPPVRPHFSAVGMTRPLLRNKAKEQPPALLLPQAVSMRLRDDADTNEEDMVDLKVSARLMRRP